MNKKFVAVGIALLFMLVSTVSVDAMPKPCQGWRVCVTPTPTPTITATPIPTQTPIPSNDPRCGTVYSFGCHHWMRNTQELTIGIKTVFMPSDELQAIANAAAGWSLHPLIEIGIIGEGNPALCGEDGGSEITLDTGYVLICHYPFDYTPYLPPDTNFAQWAPQAWTACDVEFPSVHKNACEFGTWHEIVHHTDGSLRMQHPCHELAHVFGFGEYRGGGCLGGANTTAEFECPTAENWDQLTALYGHGPEDHTTTGPVPVQWAVQGITNCATFFHD